MITTLFKRDIFIISFALCVYIFVQGLLQSNAVNYAASLINIYAYASVQKSFNASQLVNVKIENGVASEVPLTIAIPQEGTHINNHIYEMYGIVQKGAIVFINGEEVATNPNGSFKHQVKLENGENVIYVVAQQEEGGYSTKKVFAQLQEMETR